MLNMLSTRDPKTNKLEVSLITGSLNKFEIYTEKPLTDGQLQDLFGLASLMNYTGLRLKEMMNDELFKEAFKSDLLVKKELT